MTKNILIIGGCGYIGTRLVGYLNKTKLYTVDSIDLEWFGNYLDDYNLNSRIDFNLLGEQDLDKYKVIILLAGMSSVGMSKGYLATYSNNVFNFTRLTSYLKPHQKFIYASSASVYGRADDSFADETFNDFVTVNNYDLSKWQIDLQAKMLDTNYFGLRFGTVCGFSKNLRPELMINSMMLSAIKDNKIKVANKWINRPILGLNDLCKAIETIIENKDVKRGIYNIASFNTNVNNIALEISDITKAPIEYLPDTPSYNMSMSTSKFETTFGFKFRDTVQSITQELVDNLDKVQNMQDRSQPKNYFIRP